MTQWAFEADYFTACNCDWGCPCNFNARPTEGRCIGLCAWSILTGRFGETVLYGTRFVLYYAFPGPIEQGQGTGCAYVDSRATAAQQRAVEAIGQGKVGGGFFDLFGTLMTTWLPTKHVPIEFEFKDASGRVRIEGFGRRRANCSATPTVPPSGPGSTCPTASSSRRG